jgi:PPOX class probable F420-dependent enzyme
VTLSAAEARERFAAARVARLATADAAGRPHLVPVVFAVAGDVIYSVVDAKPKRTSALRRLRNVAENPFVALLADHYDDADWSALWWVRAEGRARVLGASDTAESGHALDLLVARYPQYRTSRPAGPVVALDVERVTGWAASEPEQPGPSAR